MKDGKYAASIVILERNVTIAWLLPTCYVIRDTAVLGDHTWKAFF
jgi:hypothetical protein